MLWSFYPWKYSKPDWMQSWTTSWSSSSLIRQVQKVSSILTSMKNKHRVLIFHLSISWSSEPSLTVFILSLEPAVPFPLLYIFSYSLSAESTPRLLCRNWQGQCHTFVSGITKALFSFSAVSLQQTISRDLSLLKAVVSARGWLHLAFLSGLPPL